MCLCDNGFGQEGGKNYLGWWASGVGWNGEKCVCVTTVGDPVVFGLLASGWNPADSVLDSWAAG